MNRKPDPERHATLVRYLLDQLSEEQRDRLEERLLVDKAVQEDLAVAEEEVADLFINGDLPPEQRRFLEHKFAGCPGWSERLAFARLMDRAVEQRIAVSGSGGLLGRKWPLLALASAAAALAVWMWLVPDRKPGVPAVLPPETARPISSFLLTPALRNGRGVQSDNVVELAPGTGRIELRLPFDGDLYPTYQVQLQSLDSGQTVSLGTITPSHQAGANPDLRIQLDSAGLRAGRYTIILRATETDGSIANVAGYSFRFAKRE